MRSPSNTRPNRKERQGASRSLAFFAANLNRAIRRATTRLHLPVLGALRRSPIIQVAPDQLYILIQWLKSAREELWPKGPEPGLDDIPF